MVELDYEVKREGLSFAARVKLLASEAPDTFAATALHRAANLMDSHYGFSVREKKKAILQYMRKMGGNCSIVELKAHFKWHVDVISRLAGELESDGEIVFYNADPAGSGSGRKARRMRLKTETVGNLSPPKT
ncbi:MAG: hypothetical protein IPL32_20035 [Chloracidobacterium sp.]|nr:hypothetical protein [Chloracidobacterium sp.]